MSSILSPSTIAEALQSTDRRGFLDLTILSENIECVCEHPPHHRLLPPNKSVQMAIEALELTPEDRVLHVGVGFGFTTMVLSKLVDQVVALECQQHRADFTRQMMERGGRNNVSVVHAQSGQDKIDGPFDAILVETSTGKIPRTLLNYLTPGGRLVTCRPTDDETCQLFRYKKVGDDFEVEPLQILTVIPSLEELLADLGVINLDELEVLISGATVNNLAALRQSDTFDEDKIYQALSLQRGIGFYRAEELLRQVERQALSLLPRPFMKHHNIAPIWVRDGVFMIASPNPDIDLRLLRAASESKEVRLGLITPTDYRRLWQAIELEQFGIIEIEDSEPHSVGVPNRFTDPQITSVDQSQRHTAIFNGILLDAVGERASDIHLERYENRIRVRFRIDGECIDMQRYHISPSELLGIINVIKIGSNLDIAERRLPQGGRMEYRVGKQAFDLRIQTQPTHHGEYVVIRLLPRDNKMLSIRDLGFPEDQALLYERLLISPSGLLLVVGPTGSGKSTTLYAGLQVLADDSTRKVITIEDPVEYSIDNIQQTQVKPHIGFNFADAMRSFVRQDPDVILVGEIRDGETALEAIRASQTGHLVMSTLHSNDAVDAVQRLFDLGMHANSISSELVAVIAQRLARRICTSCREEVPLDPEVAAEVFPDGPPKGFTAFRGRGCSQCEHRGTRGRVAVLEFLRVNASIRRAIAASLQVDELRDRCLESGLIPMRETGLELVQQGVIPFEELRRILPEERMASELLATS